MDSPLLTLFIALLFGFCAFMVEAQQNANHPPEISLPPPPPHPESPPPPFTPPPPSWSPHPFSQLPPPQLRSSPPPRSLSPPLLRKPHRHSNHNLHTKLSPPPKKENLNKEKIIGLMFVGVAAILQVCIVAFLLIRRGQLLKG
ncbi:pollen-specific leucine-rich repeat extensin-like protein 3 [Sesamum indicum]|uniref:Pollen-specific leucine-rich repeat extensin-like protein 3 n=1 Tax=Sesamum indicum TaxID=4182 RepID=A0A8M8UVH0_SESIN|nr:pollen-specific leucine-rich repeat extensin-like protein 3 [Sesamum indicum]